MSGFCENCSEIVTVLPIRKNSCLACVQGLHTKKEHLKQYQDKYYKSKGIVGKSRRGEYVKSGRQIDKEFQKEEALNKNKMVEEINKIIDST